jgi:hypothetical protein
MGYGTTSEGGSLSYYLREVNLDVSDFASCNALWGGTLDEDIQFCVRVYPEWVHDSMQTLRLIPSSNRLTQRPRIRAKVIPAGLCLMLLVSRWDWCRTDLVCRGLTAIVVRVQQILLIVRFTVQVVQDLIHQQSTSD